MEASSLAARPFGCLSSMSAPSCSSSCEASASAVTKSCYSSSLVSSGKGHGRFYCERNLPYLAIIKERYQGKMSSIALHSGFLGFRLKPTSVASLKKRTQHSARTSSYTHNGASFRHQELFTGGSSDPNLKLNHSQSLNIILCTSLDGTNPSSGPSSSINPPPAPTESSSNKTSARSSLLGALFTAGGAPALAAEQAAPHAGGAGEPIHTVVWLAVAAVLAALGWAFRARWDSILQTLVKFYASS